MNTPKSITIQAHCSDCFNMQVTGHDWKTIFETNGYVPRDLCIGGGDDVELEIDIETGTIRGWDAAKVKERLQEMAEENDD